MVVFLKLVAEYAVWLYGLWAVLALLLLRLTLQARRERRQALFTLEREAAMKRVGRLTWATAGLVAALALTLAVERYLAPALPFPVETVPPTATPPLLLLPTPTATVATPTPLLQTPTVTATRPRPTRPPEPPTPTPATKAAPPVAPPQCPHPGAQITSPGMGQVVRGVVDFTGTAQIERFQYYKLELGVGEAPQEWAFLFNRPSPVVNGHLGSWNSAVVPPGVYTLRLVVVDQAGNYPPPCQVTVRVER